MMEPDVWQIMLGRLREAPGVAWVTTTPRGDNWVYRTWGKQARPDYALIHSSTRENAFLPPDFVRSLSESYTARFARQEIEGEFLLDTPGALWTRATLDACRVPGPPLLSRPASIVAGLSVTRYSPSTGATENGETTVPSRRTARPPRSSSATR